MGIETKGAPEKWKLMLHRVLEHVSIDYELLRLDIVVPDWIKELLQTDPER